MPAPTHPTADQLRAFVQGHASAAEQAAVTAHLDHCADCCARLDTLFAQDALLGRIQEAAQTDGKIVVAEVQRRQAVRALHRGMGSTAIANRADTSTADLAANLDHTLSPFLTTAPEGQDLPRRAGEYEILEELGRGGMGVVFKARHLALNRLVALKMLHKGAVAEGESLARFREEAKVVARLQLPGIVQIHEVGTLEGQPYLALEYVPGSSLDRFLDGMPQPPQDAAAFLRPVAAAMHAAHQQGVVHRDLKPANILLFSRAPQARAGDAAARTCGARLNDSIPKITDFGLAKPLDDDSGLTRTGIIVGTPYYMAPEQAEGGKTLTPAADLYALGTILYEMLTGRPPFKGTTVHETLRQVVADDPLPPRRLQPGIPTDLETICLKCLHKEPAQRYATAADFGDDLGRFLEGRPILARPVGRVERTWRWCRRNPVVAGLTAAVFLLLLASSMTGWLLAAWALQAEETTKQERDTARQERQRAEDNLAKVREAVDDTYLICREHPLFQGEAMRQHRRLLLAKAVPFYQGFVRQKGDDPAFRAEHANILHRLAFSYSEVGPTADAIPTCRQALKIYERLAADHPQAPAYLEHLAQTWNTLGIIQQGQGHQKEGLASFRHAQECALRLTKLSSFMVKHQRIAVQFCNNLGMALRSLGQHQEALASFSQMRQILEELVAAYPHCLDYQLQLACSYDMLAEMHLRLNQVSETIACHQAACCLWQSLLTAQPGEISYAVGLGANCCNLGLIERQVGQPHAALAHLTLGVRTLSGLLQREPRHGQARVFLRNALHERALALEQLRRASASWQDCRRAFTVALGLPNPGPGPHDVMARVQDLARAEHSWLVSLGVTKAINSSGPAAFVVNFVPNLQWTLSEPD